MEIKYGLIEMKNGWGLLENGGVIYFPTLQEAFDQIDEWETEALQA